MTAERVLVIKHSALGDFVQATGAFAAIRAHHALDHITLLTTQPFAGIAKASPYFNEIWCDARPRIWDVAGLMRLKKKLRSVKFARVYDLQTSKRSSSYFHIMGDPPWSGIAHGCDFPHANPDREQMHPLDRLAEQLAMAGISPTPPPDISWLTADTARFGLPQRFLLLLPGGAPHRPTKRWPVQHFADIANRASASDIMPVLIGTKIDRDPVHEIMALCPYAASLIDKTSFAELAALARRALGAVSNDTAPTHLLAAAGCPVVVLFSQDTDPGLRAPRGRVAVLKRPQLTDLPADEVWAALQDGPGALCDPETR